MQWRTNTCLLILALLTPIASVGSAENLAHRLGELQNGITINAHQGYVRKTAFLVGRKHRLLSLGYQDKQLKLWQPVTGELLSSVELRFNPQDFVVAKNQRSIDVLLTTGSIMTIPLENDEFGEPKSHWGTPGRYGRLAISPSGKFYAVVSRNKDALIWDAEKRSLHQSYAGTRDYQTVTFTGTDRSFAAGNGNEFSLWDILANEGFGAKENFVIPGVTQGSDALDMVYHRLSEQMATTHLDGQVTLWQLSGSLKATFSRSIALPQSAFSPVFSPGGDWLFIACGDGNAWGYETATGKLTSKLSGDGSTMITLAINSSAALMAAGTQQGRIVVWWVPQ